VLSSRLQRDARPDLNEFLRHVEAEMMPFTEEQATLAVDTFLATGRVDIPRR